MLHRIVSFGIAVAFLSVPALAQQATHVPGGTGIDNANPYDSGSATDQYLHQQSMDNLPGGKANSAVKIERSRPAAASELIAGAAVNDKSGVAMAKIDQVDADGIIVSTGTLKVKIPAGAFGHNKKGLLLDMTKAQFDQIVAKANATS